MALQGTIGDFGLADIFQLIGIQRKTGVLELDNGEDGVAVKFLDGHVVGADLRACGVETLLGNVLVRTGRITEKQLQESLAVQKKTLQRLGYVLVRRELIDEDDLVEALRVQSLQIVYRLFRWRVGSYSFKTADDIDYDSKHFAPISAETILMEGARMIDEWPIIERRIKNDQMILRPTEAAKDLDLGMTAMVEEDFDIDLAFDPDGAAAAAKKPVDALQLSGEEQEVLLLVDGVRTVGEVNDRSTLGEFDTFRILSDLMTRSLVEVVEKPTAANIPKKPAGLLQKLFVVVSLTVVFGAALIGLVSLSSNPLAPWRLTGSDTASRELRAYASQARVDRLDEALQVFYLDAGTFPESLELLAVGGYLPEYALSDPWGRLYGYRLSDGGFQIFGMDADGEPSPTLTFSRSFTPTQRM
ncbi:MAG: DUF4388 domain-containing protein, partial [Acidobacteriota bacterium]|nr:DUF4388 domain-containing protein [Acidobacteriota bacterium]